MTPDDERRAGAYRRRLFRVGLLLTVLLSYAAYFAVVSFMVSTDTCHYFQLRSRFTIAVVSVPLLLNGMALFWLVAFFLRRKRALEGTWVFPVVAAWVAPAALDVVLYHALKTLSAGTEAAAGAAILLAAGAATIVLVPVGVVANIWALVTYPLGDAPRPSDGPAGAMPNQSDGRAEDEEK